MGENLVYFSDLTEKLQSRFDIVINSARLIGSGDTRAAALSSDLRVLTSNWKVNKTRSGIYNYIYYP